MRLGLVLAAVWLIASPAVAQNSPDDIRKEWPDFRYLEPKQIHELPVPIREDLEKRGCKIPRFTKWDARHNAIQGRFLTAGRQDWALLCQHQDKTSILIYPGGATAEVQALRSEDNDPYRVIHTVTAFVLAKRAIRDQQTETVPAFDHDGIEDGPIQKTAIVVYYRDDVWEEF